MDDVRSALDNSGLDATLLTLELTETSLMQHVVASAARLELLKAIGTRIAIDDFGTGYSSMAYLQQFPIDLLKVDQSFVSHITESAEAAALVHTLVQLGKTLGIATTAEGIETNDQRMWLRSEGVDGGQGYLFSPPIEADAVTALLAGTGGQSELVVAGP